MFAIGLAIEKSLIAPVLKADVMAQLLLTFGLMLVIQNAVAYFWTTNERLIRPAYGSTFFQLSGVVIERPYGYNLRSSHLFCRRTAPLPDTHVMGLGHQGHVAGQGSGRSFRHKRIDHLRNGFWLGHSHGWSCGRAALNLLSDYS